MTKMKNSLLIQLRLQSFKHFGVVAQQEKIFLKKNAAQFSSNLMLGCGVPGEGLTK